LGDRRKGEGGLTAVCSGAGGSEAAGITGCWIAGREASDGCDVDDAGGHVFVGAFEEERLQTGKIVRFSLT
jgi:hypothetical protein